MTTEQMIEKLSDKDRAQPYGVLAAEERQVLDKAGIHNCLILDSHIGWMTTKAVRFFDGHSYIIKPGYGPEYEDIEVFHGDGWFTLTENMPYKNNSCIYDCLIHPDFVAFRWRKGVAGVDVDIRVDTVAKYVRDGHKVYARFVKVTK